MTRPLSLSKPLHQEVGDITREVRWEVVSMTGMDDEFSEIPQVATQNLWAQAY